MAHLHSNPSLRARSAAVRASGKTKLALTVLLALSCSRTDAYLDSPEIEQVSITGALTSIEVADTVRLTAVGTASDGATVQDPAVTWSSSDRTIATVNQ